MSGERTLERADAHFAKGEYAQALPLYRALLRAHEKSKAPELRIPALHAQLASCLQMTGKHEEALLFYARALAARPDTVHLWKASCFSAGELSRWDQMKNAAERALSLAQSQKLPDDGYVWRQLAIAEGELGHSKAAIRAAEKAVELQPEDGYHRYALACHLLGAGRRDEAFRELEGALAHNPELLDAAESTDGSEPSERQFAGDARMARFAAWARAALAIRNGDERAFAKSLRGGLDVKKTLAGVSLLRVAVRHDNAALVQKLLESGARWEPALLAVAAELDQREAFFAMLDAAPKPAKARLPRLPASHRKLRLELPRALLPLARDIAKTVEPAWRVRAVRAKKVSPTSTHFGGDAFGEPPRCSECGESMVFFWQLNLADFAAHPVMKGQGLWQVFACTAHYPRYAFRANVDPRHARGNARKSAPKSAEPLSRAVIEPMLSVPAAADPRSAVYARTDEWSFGDDGGDHARLWAVHNFAPAFCIEEPIVSRVGGHPPWIQGPDEPKPCRVCGTPQKFVAAIGSGDTDILYGDTGYFYFFTCSATARCPGLGNCTTVHQCY